MFTQIIGEKRAKEYARLAYIEAESKNIYLPQCIRFAAEGPVPGVLIEFHNEITEYMRKERWAYDDINKITAYVQSLLPTQAQIQMALFYDIDVIKNLKGK